jgi:transcriptional regulator with XRE-family HTH domain
MSNDQERLILGQRLRTSRDYLGFSQDEVAKHLSISRTALSNIESGQRKVDALELKKLAALYQRSIAYFTGDVVAEAAMPADVEHLARQAQELSSKDREELTRFAAFLGSQTKRASRKDGGDGDAQ